MVKIFELIDSAGCCLHVERYNKTWFCCIEYEGHDTGHTVNYSLKFALREVFDLVPKHVTTFQEIKEKLINETENLS